MRAARSERQAERMQERDVAAEYRINIRSLLERLNERKSISLQIGAEAAALYGLHFAELPQMDGLLENRAGVLMLTYTLRCVLLCACDRCLAETRQEIDEQFTHVIVTETASEQNDAEYLLAPDAVLDLAETAMTDLRLSLPTKTLCRSDCLGLCPVCGKNRNEGECGCAEGAVTFSFEEE